MIKNSQKIFVFLMRMTDEKRSILKMLILFELMIAI